jgi:hypothetical protein
MEKETSTIRVSLELRKDGVKNIIVSADTAEGRDAALERLRAALPALELLEAQLQAEIL